MNDNSSTNVALGACVAVIAVSSAFAGGGGAAGRGDPPCTPTPVRQVDVSSVPTRDAFFSMPSSVHFNGRMYFDAIVPQSQEVAIWRTDGTPSGTTQVFSQPAQSLSESMRVVLATSDAVYFTSNNDHTLWRTEGSSSSVEQIDSGVSRLFTVRNVGTRIVYAATDSVQIRTWAPGDAAPAVLSPGRVLGSAIELNGRIVFSTESSGTFRVYSTDGTPGGTTLLFSGSGGSTDTAPGLYKVTDRLLFVGTTPETGTEVFQTDGTAAGTRVFFEFAPGAASVPDTRAVAGALGKFFFTGNNRFMATDGVSTVDLGSNYRVQSRFVNAPVPVVNGRLILGASAQAPLSPTGFEPFVTDGTPENTGLLLEDLIPGADGSFDFTCVAAVLDESRCVFTALRADLGAVNLYVTDGTAAGSAVLIDGVTVTSRSLVADSGRAFFSRGGNLWVTDGTPSPLGTHLVSDLVPAYDEDRVKDLVSFPGRGVIFAARSDVVGRELWFSNGVPEGTVSLGDIALGSYSSSPSRYGMLGSRAIFSTSPIVPVGDLNVLVPAPGALYFWDGSALPPTIIAQSTAGDPSSVELRGATPLLSLGDGRVLFSAGFLGVTDGTAANTRRLTSVTDPALPPASEVSYPTSSPVCPLPSGAVFRGSTSGAGLEPAVTDGTVEGTRIIRDLRPGPVGSNPGSFFPINGRVIFRANALSDSGELWVTDGTDAGTRILMDLSSGPVRRLASGFVEFGGRAVFVAEVADGASSQLRFFSTDGTPEGTGDVGIPAPLVRIANSSQLARSPHGVLFTGIDHLGNVGLWVTSGTLVGTQIVRDIIPTSVPETSLEFTPLGPLATVRVGVVSPQLWVTDGSFEGTVSLAVAFTTAMITGVSEGACGDGRTFFFVYTGSSPTSPVYLARFDGQNFAQSCLVATFSRDQIPDAVSWAPTAGLTLINNRLFLNPGSPVIGVEPAVINLCPPDFNNSGGEPNVQDVFDFLGAFFGGDARADINNSGGVPTVQDVFEFIAMWFAGCPG